MKINIKKLSLYLLGLGLINNYQMIISLKQFGSKICSLGLSKAGIFSGYVSKNSFSNTVESSSIINYINKYLKKYEDVLHSEKLLNDLSKKNIIDYNDNHYKEIRIRNYSPGYSYGANTIKNFLSMEYEVLLYIKIIVEENISSEDQLINTNKILSSEDPLISINKKKISFDIIFSDPFQNGDETTWYGIGSEQKLYGIKFRNSYFVVSSYIKDMLETLSTKENKFNIVEAGSLLKFYDEEAKNNYYSKK